MLIADHKGNITLENIDIEMLVSVFGNAGLDIKNFFPKQDYELNLKVNTKIWGDIF